VRACELAMKPIEQSWLIEGFWGDECVGFISAHPKSNKSWLSLDMAVSVASGTPCLGRFAVGRPGPVLVYAAEDHLDTVRTRVAGLCASRGLAWDDLAVYVITEPVVRLDRIEDQERLRRTLDQVRPRALFLDPLVRVYGVVDENSAQEVSRFLSYLRALQREYRMAVVLVHHARKAQAGAHQAGQSLRGSGDLYAWVDELISLRRTPECLMMSIEHRAAASPEPLSIRLVHQGPEPPHLVILDGAERAGKATWRERLLLFLTRAPGPCVTAQIRAELGLRKETIVDLLRTLEASGEIRRVGRGWARSEEGSRVNREPVTGQPSPEAVD
jgi:hypothetical protein